MKQDEYWEENDIEDIEEVDIEAEEDEDWEEEDRGGGKWIFYVIPSAAVVILAVFFLVRFLSGRGQAQEEPVSADAEWIEEMENLPLEGEEIPEAEPEETPQEENEAETDVKTPEEEDAEDPQQELQGEEGSEVDITQETVQAGVGENASLSLGIDVSKYQGIINWEQVAASGVQFAMIRVGYRTQVSGVICEDPAAKYNMQEATANGLKIGAYFFSTAVNEAEAIEEADWTADYIAQYQITYPVAYNCEGFRREENRQFSLDKETRSNVAAAFLNRISERGYTPMFYAAKNEMEADKDWNTGTISAKYKIWVSQYPEQPFPTTEKSSYSGTHAMWQYTNMGRIPGISKNVDINLAYFGYDSAAEAKSDEEPETVEADLDAFMDFTEVNETVTAKDVVNLRDMPSQGEESTVLGTLSNGEEAQRTGVSPGGWSRLVIDGQKVYAVSSFLTTDLSYETPDTAAPTEPPSDNGLKTKFSPVEESVTAKIEVNLRTLPSVTREDAAVVAVLKNGEWITRTGISDNGWSRVEYDGQTLYCISSYLTTG